MTDSGTRQEAHSTLSGLFQGLGHASADSGGGGLGGMLGQLQEFVEMPMELAQLFLNMSTQLAELVLKSLEEAGFVLVKGMTPL